MLISVQAGTAIVGAMLSARIVKRVGEIAATAIAFALGGAGIFLTVFPSLAVVIGAYALAGFAVPLGGVSAYNALQHRTPGRLFARTMVAFTSAVSLPQAIGIPAAAVLLVTVGFRTLILICFAITMLASAYVWRGRGLTQPSRRATLAAHPLVEAPCTRRSPSQPATLARRRQSRKLGIGGGIVGSGAVLVNARNIRTFDDRVGAIAHAAVPSRHADLARRQGGLAGQAAAGSLRPCHGRGAGRVGAMRVLAVRGERVHRHQDLGPALRPGGDDQR